MKKICVIDDIYSINIISNLVADYKKRNKVKIGYSASNSLQERNIPKGHDLYFLDLGRINTEDLTEIRKDNPKSYIVLTGLKNMHNHKELKRVTDEMHTFLNQKEIGKVLEARLK